MDRHFVARGQGRTDSASAGRSSIDGILAEARAMNGHPQLITLGHALDER
jgi:hypothetical protein